MNVLRSCNARTLIAAAVSFAFVMGQPALASNKQVELIPDDTLFYMGTGKPVPVDDFFSMLPGVFDAELLKDVIPEIGDSEASEETLQKIADFIKDPTALTKEWGLGDELQFTAYTVGVMPVFRIVADGEQFDAAFSKATSDSEMDFDIITHKGVEVRVLPLDDGSENASGAASGPTADELKAAAKELEIKLSSAQEQNQAASLALETANANLEAAKTKNDASGIAKAANEIAEAASKVSDSSSMQASLEGELATLNEQANDIEKKQDANGKAGPGFITAAADNDLVFAMATNAYDPEILDQLLGMSKPETSLEDSGKLKKIRSEWDYGEEMAMYFDFELIADAITGGDSLAAQQIKKLSAGDDSEDELKLFSTDPCRAEIRQLASQVPMMVSGNRRFEVGDKEVNYDSHFAMLLENDLVKSTLKLLRGAVPVSQSSSEAMFSMGLGLNVDTAPQLSAQLTDLITGINYECEAFGKINELAEVDISTLSMGAMMFSGMARGVKGISLNIYDGNIDTNAPIPVKGIDSAIAISAENPATLLQTLRMIPQMGMLSELPMDGTPVSLNEMIPVPMPEDAEFFAAVKEKSIVIYSGEQAEDFANRIGGNGEEGFLFTTVNTRKLIDKINDIVGQLPQAMREENDLDAMAGFMKAYPTGILSYKMDFTDKGIEFETESVIERKEK